MIKISKITDYGIVLLTFLAHQKDQVWTAKDLSQATHIPLPTVGKILKLLSKAEVLNSTRGSQGGYQLSRQPHELSLASIIKALEGQVALTDCSEKGNHSCGIQTFCVNKSNWRKINEALYEALEDVSLSDMTKPLVRPPKILFKHPEVKKPEVTV